MTDDTSWDRDIRSAAKKYGVDYDDLKVMIEIERQLQVKDVAMQLREHVDEISARSGELAYLMQYEGDIFANAERYRTIRDSIVARAN